jgi:hypothetical protein
MILAADPDQPLPVTICRQCGQWMIAAPLPLPPLEQLCPPCQKAIRDDQEETR